MKNWQKQPQGFWGKWDWGTTLKPFISDTFKKYPKERNKMVAAFTHFKG